MRDPLLDHAAAEIGSNQSLLCVGSTGTTIFAFPLSTGL